MTDEPILIHGEVRFKSGTISDAERRLWEEYHGGFSPMIACDRKDLTAVAPDLVPEGLSGRVKDVPVSRDYLWRALTGKPRKKESWNV